MKASLDTNVIIHLYRAEKQQLLFQRFDEGVFIYEQIRQIELQHHGQDILGKVDKDITDNRIQIYTDQRLKNEGVFTLFQGHVRENRLLYGTGDLGEVYAISLAETIGAYSLVTDDTKQGGPYMSLLQFHDNDIMPFTYADVLIMNYLEGILTTEETIRFFNDINSVSDLNWSFKSQLTKFVKRFWSNPYQDSEHKWMIHFCDKKGINARKKLKELLCIISKFT